MRSVLRVDFNALGQRAQVIAAIAAAGTPRRSECSPSGCPRTGDPDSEGPGRTVRPQRRHRLHRLQHRHFGCTGGRNGNQGSDEKADLALYKAKSAGRDCFFLFDDEMTREADERRCLETDMRAGLVRGEFELFYQPTVDVWTHHVSCVDARVRWRHPVHGLLSSDRFLSVAGSTGLIVDLGEWVLRQACRDAKAWPQHVKVTVNLSALQFRSVKFLDAMRLALGDAGLPPSRLEIEVSGAMLMDKQSCCLALLNQLRDVGVSVALDDFGTRHSSLSCLMMFSLDKIKIDGFLTGGSTERADCAASRAIPSAMRVRARSMAPLRICGPGTRTMQGQKATSVIASDNWKRLLAAATAPAINAAQSGWISGLVLKPDSPRRRSAPMAALATISSKQSQAPNGIRSRSASPTTGGWNIASSPT
jgi:EAL domain-containing protein (putative c-di-GMP-specific phosphodiesterase class I)